MSARFFLTVKMMIDKYIIYFFSAAMIISALGVVTARNMFHSGLLLGVSLLSVAGIYLLMGAEFLAAVQVLVYIGGILILILFAVMLTHKICDKSIAQTNKQKFWSLAASLAVFAILTASIIKTQFASNTITPRVVSAAEAGLEIFSGNILPFEAVSVLLLAALVGAIMMAGRENEK